MTLFRYRKNGKLYTITSERGYHGYKVHPYKHSFEIGVQHKKGNRFRNFKSSMNMNDFIPVAFT
jgi:hypothetical protein